MEHKKDLDYYMSLNYDIIVRKLAHDGEVFYQAFTRELDPIAFYGVGDTREEAIKCFEETKQAIFIDHLEHGLMIPEPAPEEDAFHSGKFVVRTTPQIHGNLILNAGRNRQSLNSLVNMIFTQYLTAEDLVASAKSAIDSAVALAVSKVKARGQVYDLPQQEWTSNATQENEANAA